ncbi:AfsR/SARP family transcriptional regulator [Streptomyces yaizuensis]|uniref:NB-ARC domain-containing protein n=1 Tax=Streptomyces yaizuensis TaxID=2989713 RepID=A0ABQ5NRD7_9ACTN|nr:BTAD domain-containing putative transcriptional regulator [Streptomyces sp. YSPA8]GLF92936.1 NB-ARC domain-containing protein [Streptomyces sp. YSPA8]
MNESGPFAFTLLGTVRGRRGTEELALAGPQQRTALAMLLLAEGQPVAMEELIDGLWGADCPRAAATTIRTYVSRIRTVLEPGHRALGGPSLLVSVGSSYALRLPGDGRCLDVTLAEQEVEAAAEARRAGDAARAQSLLRRAADRWQGPPLTGLTGPFAETWRERLTQRYLGVLESRVELDLELGDARAAVTDLTRRTAEHPLRESLRLLLMRALYQCGRQAEALEVFRDIRAVLSRELGIDPDPRLRTLYERILRADPDLLPSPADPAFTDPAAATRAPGPRTPEDSRDTAEPPVPASATPRGTAPTAHIGTRTGVPGTPVPAQLPADTADFTGRDRLVDELLGLLTAPCDPAVRICAISGIGGSGKTALAVHVAHRLRAHFPAGQLFVDLAGVTEHPSDPRTVLGQLLHALGVPETAVPDELEARAALFRTVLSEQRMLVVLDNAAGAEQIRPLLPGYPGCAVIVTSRSRLTAVPAHAVELEPFRPDESLELLTTVIGRDRVRAEPDAARELLATCGHLPLAVRVVACRIVARPRTTIADSLRRLSDERRRLDQLRTGDLDVVACFQLGYDQLAPEPARAFRLLSLPQAETVSLAMAAALLDTDEYEAERVLDELLHTGLLHSPQLGRYRYHDLLRLFARRLTSLTDPEEQVTRALERLLRSLTATVHHAYRSVRPGHRIAGLLDRPADPAPVFPDPRSAHDWFDQEREAVLAVLAQAVRRSPELAAKAAFVLLGLDPLLERAYAWGDVVELCRAVVAATREAGPPDAQAAALYMLSGALWQVSRPGEAADPIERAVGLCRRSGNRVLLAESLNVQALILASPSGYDRRTVALLREARQTHRSVDNPSGEANTLGNLTYAHMTLGEPEEAVRTATAGLALYRGLGDRMGEAQILSHRGTSHRLLGNTDTAMESYTTALELSRELGLRFLEANLLYRIAQTHLAAGAAATGAAVAEEARVLCRELGLARTEARVLVVLGQALAGDGSHQLAGTWLREAVSIFRKLGFTEVEEAERALAALPDAATGNVVPLTRQRPTGKKNLRRVGAE